MTATPWIENLELFSEQLAVGHRYAMRVGAALLHSGHAVTVAPSTLRASTDDIDGYRDDIDVLITNPNGEQFIVESKSRGIEFGESPESYPYETAFVDTVAGWDRKTRKPGAVVLTSQKTGAMLVIPGRSQPTWTQGTTRDRVRDITDTWYLAPRGELRTMEELVGYLANWWWVP